MNPRRAFPYVAVLLGALAIAVAAGAPRRSGPALDPASTDASGTKALVESLSALGARVRVSPDSPDGSVDVMLVLRDDLDPSRSADVGRWVEGGGTLVLADPSSALGVARPSGTTAVALVEPRLSRRCDVPALASVDQVLVPGASLLRVPEGAVGCFTEGSRDAYLVTAAAGQGRLVQLGGAGLFTNENLSKADNGLLAMTLLAPRPGTRVLVNVPPRAGGGTKGLTDLVSPRVKLFLLQLAIAFGLLVLWRARRLGRPVVERRPVELAGSELVVAVGNLLQRARGRPQASWLLREDLRRTLSERLGLPPDTSAGQVAAAVAARTAVPATTVLQALAGPEPTSEDDLVVLAQTIESLRQEVTSAR